MGCSHTSSCMTSTPTNTLGSRSRAAGMAISPASGARGGGGGATTRASKMDSVTDAVLVSQFAAAASEATLALFQ
eukprot:351121-Chlamydomonas_euryale.AAC.2